MTDTSATVGVVWKQESARIVAGLLRLVRDVGLAEELAQDALVAALEQWPATGVPENPGAWLMTIAKRRAVDHIRRVRTQERLAPDIARLSETDQEPGDDDVLRLMFTSCHPVLPTEARVALTLRVIAGLSPAEIARGFLVGEQVIVQRIAAAKRTLAEAGVSYEPSTQLSSVLEVVYLIFNEGYSATSGADLIRADLCLEALRLGRLLAVLAPEQAEVHGLVALMEIQQSRSAARTGPGGEPIPLHEQNRGRWDQLLIRRGFAAMLRAREAEGPPGPYVLQAAIAVCHAQARTAEETDWVRIATLYEALERLLPTPVVRLNRAVAVGFAHGPQAGLDLLDELRADSKLADYHLLPSVRGDLLVRLGRPAEGRRELERAASLARNAAERDFLLRRAAALAVPEESGMLLGPAVAGFVGSLGPATSRAYGQTLHRIARSAGDRLPLAGLTAAGIAEICAMAWPDVAPRSWNRHVAAVRSFATWAGVPELASGLRPRRARPGSVAVHAPLPPSEPSLRERALWCLLRESSAKVGAVLALNVEDLDLADRSARDGAIVWRSGTARLLPELSAGVPGGGLVPPDGGPGRGPPPAPADLCPETGRRRLSYERAEYLCKRMTGRSLGRLRHAPAVPGDPGQR
ncbi:RNA polymerase sigma factor [Actinoplanes aureus]|uniref:RNA polymerase sigma factor n=1 Tax=Actinoplanes aureus TaxID=2792083 RepID=A0A931FUM6_9ACTN|nr:RNA polymerase sigma factor [Actinoplanes aureus]MBG0560398.1 RNA polymerase subunit sigma [Actinoplanes aureus]